MNLFDCSLHKVVEETFFTSPTGDAKGTITAWSSEPSKDRFVYKAAAIRFYSVSLKHQVLVQPQESNPGPSILSTSTL